MLYVCKHHPVKSEYLFSILDYVNLKTNESVFIYPNILIIGNNN